MSQTHRTITCRRCGVFTRVINTKTHASKNIVIRRRVCADPACGASTNTYESTDMPPDLMEVTKARQPREFLIKRYIEMLDSQLIEVEDIIEELKAQDQSL